MIGGKLNKRITLLRGKVRVIVANIEEVIDEETMSIEEKEQEKKKKRKQKGK